MACSYCYVSVNQGPPVHLSLAALKRSVDYFLEKVEGPSKKITFLGGEPFLNWPLFQDIARYARARGGPGLVLQTFTNGTLMSPERLVFLDSQEVHTTISLDGRKAANDKHRVYFKNKERSVFDDVMGRIKGLPKDNLGVSLVFTHDTIDEFLSNVDYFYKMGFWRITFNPELYDVWPERKLSVMRAQLKGLTRYYKLILEKNLRPFQIQILYSIMENAGKNKAGLKWWHDCHNVVLGPEGQFYACDKPLALPIGKAEAQHVGNADTGMDWAKREGHYAEAIDFIEQRGWGKDETFCPMGVYFYAKEAGKDPEPMMANFHKVAEVFADGLLELVAELESHPVFQDIYVNARVV
ncbi:MAG: radical SAM protein [Elusimicrobia bacterium]|nr:radical SAM protein [Elusimicrobiota bacterium]